MSGILFQGGVELAAIAAQSVEPAGEAVYDGHHVPYHLLLG
jgi:hypothetical protein